MNVLDKTAAPQTLPDGDGGRRPPTTLLAPPASGEPPRRLWTRAQYRRLFESGVLAGEEPTELVEGEIVEKMYQGQSHGIACMRCQQTLTPVFGTERVRSQMTVAPDDFNEPEPDVAVLRLPLDDYPEDAPAPSELLLLVEVSATTQQRDRGMKAAIYARAGVDEYWILDIVARTLTVLREPSPNGYQSERTLAEDVSVAPLSAPDTLLRVAEMLPPLQIVQIANANEEAANANDEDAAL